jgi:tetratricopeptide (TPR) repeat protein
VTVVGEPGLGKSRLVWELGQAIDRRPELVRWRQGRCLPYGEGITFWALGEIVKAEAGVLESDSPAAAEAKVERAVASAVADESERQWLADRLAPLVGARDETAGVAREEAFSAWRRYFEALAGDGPLVLVFEDLHWADGALLDFLDDLLDWAPAIPLLVVGTARPELYTTRPGWGGGRRNSTTVGLAPLSDEETARLVAGLLERSVLPAQTQTALLERAGGNPLYTEQFVRMLVESGPASDVRVPESVQALIAARLDTLEPELKGLLQDASVLGKVFWTGVLAEMSGHHRETVLSGLRELVRREFVRPARVSSMRDEEEFSFWHVLVRDVAYQQIPRAARAGKHVRAAEWIERTAEDRVSDHAEILVHHYEQALELGRAAGDVTVAGVEPRLARFLLLAGDRAMQLDMTAAEASYRRALELAGDSPARAVVLVKLGDAFQEQGRLLEAEQAYDEALEAFRSAGDERAAALGKLGLSRALWRHGKTARARELIAEAIPVLERDPGPDLVFAYERAAAVDALGGRSEDALAWAEKGIALAGELGHANVVRLLEMRGLARLALGDAGGLDDQRDALDLSQRLGLGIATAIAYLNLAEATARFEPLASSRALMDASLDFARRRGLAHHEWWTRGSRLWLLFETGEWDELLREADEVIAWDRSQGGTQIEVTVLTTAAPVLAHRGQLEVARSYVDVILPRAREIGDPQTLVPALLVGALVAALRGDLADAVALATEFEAETRDKPAWRGPGITNATRVCIAAGELELAETLIGSSEEMPSLAEGAARATARAMVAEARGDTERATTLYREALDGWREWGSVIESAYALLGLGRCGDLDAAREGAAIFERLHAVPFAALAA